MTVADVQTLVERLREDGVRVTKQRRAILSALCCAASGLTPQLILEEGRRECPNLGLATVYRTVELLERDGYLHRLHETGGGEGLVLSLCAHAHHVVCAACGRVAEFSTCDLRQTIEEASRETGFVISEHYLELLGLCEQCAADGRRGVGDA